MEVMAWYSQPASWYCLIGIFAIVVVGFGIGRVSK